MNKKRKEGQIRHKKEMLKFREGELSRCGNCLCMTKTILKKDKLICGKCGEEK